MKRAAAPLPSAIAPPNAAPAPRKHRRRSRLALEITVALCIKLLLLVALHQLWFSHPQSKRLTDRGVATALFGPAGSQLPGKEQHDGSGP